MSKIKVKNHSGCKKRFFLSKKKKLMGSHACHRHGMIKKSSKQNNRLTGTRTISPSDAKGIKKFCFPNSIR